MNIYLINIMQKPNKVQNTVVATEIFITITILLTFILN